MPPLRQDELDLALEWPDEAQPRHASRHSQQTNRQTRDTQRDPSRSPRDRARPWAKPRRDDGQESFKCRQCRTFVGPTVSGGRHRNHCPLCLFSRHVDGDRPGDRASTCGALMAPVGTFHRPKGEQVILHRCLGCGLERHNRIAADDNGVPLLRLPLVPARTSRKHPLEEVDAIA